MSTRSGLNHPLLLGFEHFERTLERVTRTTGDGYPPYNIEQIGANRLRITLAVAGFAETDLSISLEGAQLTIRGRQADDGTPHLYIHRGIGGRQFQKTFLLADGIEVEGASLDRGLLHIEFTRPEPQSVTRTIEIRKMPRTDSHSAMPIAVVGTTSSQEGQ